MLGYCTCGSSAVGYLGIFLTHLTVQDGVDVRVTVHVGALLLAILVHSSHI